MSRKASYIPKMVSKVEDILWLFVYYSPTGLACFFGEAEFPDTEELALMVSAKYTVAEDVGRVDGRKDIPHQQLIIESAGNINDVLSSIGGLASAQSVFTLYQAEFPTNAQMLKDMAYIGRSFKYPSIEVFAYKHHLTVRQFYRKRAKALIEISWEIYRRWRISNRCVTA